MLRDETVAPATVDARDLAGTPQVCIPRAPVSSTPMHWLDRAAEIAAARLPPGKRPFNLGWGDQDVVDHYIANARNVPPIPTIDPSIRPARRAGRIVMRDLTFPSPFEMLPDEISTVRARWITTHPEPERVVVLEPPWNDESYAGRTRLARDLLARGIASVLPQYPFYGDRRRSGNPGSPVPFVSDFCLMGRGAVLEGRALARHLHGQGHRVGVSGFSMGGNIAGFVGTLVDFPVAVAPLAASYAAGPPFMTGLLRNTLPWDALGGDDPETVARLDEVVNAGSILDHPAAPHTRWAVLVAGTRDGFVPSAAVQAIHRHWPGSRLRWVNAGHASLLLKRSRLVDGIVESFDRLDDGA